jgi:DNA-binding MarR family transcriptional regulator
LLVAISARSLAAVEERVTLPQFRMLVVLATDGEMKLITLAERLAVNPSTAMRMVDRLASAGLVHRRANPVNRRETFLCLTDGGRQIVNEVTARRRGEIAAIVARMPQAQRSGMVVALRSFADAGHEPLVDPPARDAFPLGWD